jgi:colicin import membrane protein
MGPLTESMTRLCGEIVTLRGARLTFVRDLGQDVAAMKADFRRTHAEMGRRTKAERQGFVKALGDEVASLMAGFHRAHKAMARQTKAERRAAVNHLKKTVGGMRREFALDLAGAHRVWFGPSPAERRAKAEAERHAKAEAEQRAKAEAAQRAKQAAERDRLAALAMAKEEAVRHHAAHAPKEELGRPGKKKG